jgi:ketosteroid isomerase-like protein
MCPVKTRLRFLITLALLLNVFAVAAERDVNVLLQADRDFAKATASNGVDGWMSFMASGAVLLGTQPVVGPEKIREVMQQDLGPGSLTWEPTKAEFVGEGNVGFTIGRFESRGTAKDGKPQIVRGTYMTTWQQQKDGSWKVIGDIGTPDKQP